MGIEQCSEIEAILRLAHAMHGVVSRYFFEVYYIQLLSGRPTDRDYILLHKEFEASMTRSLEKNRWCS